MVSQRPADKVKWLWIDYRVDVPSWIATEVGRIVVEWSRLEAHFEEVVRLLIPADMHIGRAVTTGMSLRTRIKVAVDLVQAYVYYGQLSRDLLDEVADIRTKITDRPGYEAERNKFAHGLWGRVEGRWCLLRTSGTRSIPEVHAEVGRLSRTILVQKEEITRTKLTDTLQIIRSLNARLEAFCAKLEAALPPSQHKSRQQTRQSHPTHARRKKAP